jgi:hypothetical protein
MGRKFSSRSVVTSLTAGATQGAGQIVVGSTSGFPTSYPYTLILDSGGAGEEVVTVTSAVGTTLTVTRGEDGTAPVSHLAGVKVVHGVSARDFAETVAHIESTADVHGITSTADLSRKSAVETHSGLKTFSQPVTLLGAPTVDGHAATLGTVKSQIASSLEASTAPAALGTASAGTSAKASKSDHVHKRPTPAELGAVATNHVHASRVTLGPGVKSEAVTWPALSGTLSVVCTPYAPSVPFVSWVSNLSATGCTIHVDRVDGATWTGSLSVHYIVVSADA